MNLIAAIPTKEVFVVGISLLILLAGCRVVKQKQAPMKVLIDGQPAENGSPAQRALLSQKLDSPSQKLDSPADKQPPFSQPNHAQNTHSTLANQAISSSIPSPTPSTPPTSPPVSPLAQSPASPSSSVVPATLISTPSLPEQTSPKSHSAFANQSQERPDVQAPVLRVAPQNVAPQNVASQNIANASSSQETQLSPPSTQQAVEFLPIHSVLAPAPANRSASTPSSISSSTPTRSTDTSVIPLDTLHVSSIAQSADGGFVAIIRHSNRDFDVVRNQTSFWAKLGDETKHINVDQVLRNSVLVMIDGQSYEISTE